MTYPKLTEPADRLRWARAQKYKTATGAATALGISPDTYRAYENGRRNFGKQKAEIFARKFGVDGLWLYHGPDTLNRQALTPEEAALLDKYRLTDEAGQNAIQSIAEALSERSAGTNRHRA